MNALRRVVPVLALAALAATGCMLLSGQFDVNYALPSPLTFNSTGLFAGVPVDLNNTREYRKRKSDLKRVDDLALIGEFRNNTANSVNIEVWIVPSGALTLTPATLPTAAGASKLWGPLAVPGNATVNVDWNKSSSLFVGRQALADEVKGDGQFSLYLRGTSATFDVTLSNGAVIALISAAK